MRTEYSDNPFLKITTLYSEHYLEPAGPYEIEKK
jgi:hypothetical protein